MPYDSEGNFTRIHNWEDDRINDIDIVTDHHDEEDDNFASGLSECFLKDGRATMKGNIDCGNFQIKNLANGALDGDAVNKSQLDENISNLENAIKKVLNSTIKIGDIKASTITKDHDNWMICNGREISRSEYSDLFALIGTNFGAGNNVTTFNLPDYRGKFLRGLGGDSGTMYATQAEGLPNITGNWTGSTSPGTTTNNLGFTSANGCYYGDKPGNQIQHDHSGNSEKPTRMNFDASRSSKIYGASSHVTPVNQAVNYFIKVKED